MNVNIMGGLKPGGKDPPIKKRTTEPTERDDVNALVSRLTTSSASKGGRKRRKRTRKKAKLLLDETEKQEKETTGLNTTSVVTDVEKVNVVTDVEKVKKPPIQIYLVVIIEMHIMIIYQSLY